jgi:hypothetical protein
MAEFRTHTHMKTNIENANALREYAHKAASTAGRIAKADRQHNDLQTAITGKATIDKYNAHKSRTPLEMEHLGFMKAVALINKLAKVNLADCLAPAPENIAAETEAPEVVAPAHEVAETEAPEVVAPAHEVAETEAPEVVAPAHEVETPRKPAKPAKVIA